MRRTLLALAALIASGVAAKAQQIPCYDYAIFNVTTTPNTLLIAAPTDPTKRIGLCGWYASNADSNKQGNFQFVYGSGTNCAIGGQNLTPPVMVNFDAWIINRNTYVVETAPLGASVCVNGTGSIAGIFGTAYFAIY